MREDRFAYLALLAGLSSIPPLSVDMGLPALTLIAHDLHAAAGMAGLTLSMFMAGFAATPMVFGMLSDRYGRKKLLLIGLILFTLGGVGCVMAPSIGWLLFARIVQGTGAGVGPTLAMAATRDRFSGMQLRRRLGELTMLRSLAPIIAPSLGAGFLVLGGWRTIYTFLTIGGMVLLATVMLGFEETVPESRRQSGSLLRELRGSARRLAGERRTLGYGAVYGLCSGSMFAYVAGSPLVVVGIFKASPILYAALFACTATGVAAGAFLSGRLAHRLTTGQVLALGAGMALIGPIAAGVLLIAHLGGLSAVMPCMVLATFSFGMLAATASHAALEPVAEIAGAASALMNTFQMACMCLSSLLVAALYPLVGAGAMPLIMILFATGTAAVLLAMTPRSTDRRAATAIVRGEAQ
jgi:DHA1 family bicyclomycin/chloramphenicol resistance-like MFS transporter